VDTDGSLRWYKNLFQDGGQNWDHRSGHQIGCGWDEFTHVFSGSGEVIYAMRPTGELLWYKDLKRDGTNGPNAESVWDARSGSQIGVGWNQFIRIFSGINGIIYALRSTGELLWYKDLKRDGTNGPNGESGWHANSCNQIGIDWGQFTQLFPASTARSFTPWLRLQVSTRQERTRQQLCVVQSVP
jgi:hypothetical protein